MKVFIAWSGKYGQKVAELIHAEFGIILNQIDFICSSIDIKKASLWTADLLSQLKMSDFCIACVTPDSKDSKWIHFEAGVFASKIEPSIGPILVDVLPSEIDGPFALYQSTQFEEKSIFELINRINQQSLNPIQETHLKRLYSIGWKEMHTGLCEIKEKMKEKDCRAEGEVHNQVDHNTYTNEEILAIVRGLSAKAKHSQSSEIFKQAERVEMNTSKYIEGLLKNANAAIME